MDLLTPDLGVIFWQSITFFFAFLILKKFAWKPILKTIEDRESDINSALLGATNARKETKQLETDKAHIIESAKKTSSDIISEANITKSLIVENAKKEASEIILNSVNQTKKIIEKEKNDAIAQLRDEIGLLSVKIAEELLKNHLMEPKEQDKFIDKIVNSFYEKNI